jgi:hypothetical protein
MASAIFNACDSLSIRHGPPIRKRLPLPISTLPTLKGLIKADIISDYSTRRGLEFKSHRQMIREGK